VPLAGRKVMPVSCQERVAFLAGWAEGCAARLACMLEAALLEGLARHEEPAPQLLDGYAAVLAISYVGSWTARSQLLESVARHWLVSPGEFHAVDESARQRARAFLRNSCLCLAAAVGGRPQLLVPGSLERIRAYQHPCGGFFAIAPGQAHGMVDAFTTAWGGRVALRFGMSDVACSAGHFLKRLLELQPEPERAFYFAYDTYLQSPVVRVPSQPEASYRLAWQEGTGELHQVGAPIALLAELALTEPEAQWLEPLNGYLDLVQTLRPELLAQDMLGQLSEGLALACSALRKEAQGKCSSLLEACAQQLVPRVRGWEQRGSSGAETAGLDERGFSPLEEQGWLALSLLGMAGALAPYC